MSDETRKPPRRLHPHSMPPQVPVELDSSWDDDTVPGLALDDPMSESAFDRVTAIPEIPSELFAKQVMSEEPLSAPPGRGRQRPSEPATEPALLPTEPPLAPTQPPDSLESPPRPYAGHAISLTDLVAVPHANTSSVTTRPGRHPALADEPTGLDLMDLSQLGPVTSRSPVTTPLGRDPRDPLLELDLDDFALSLPPPADLMPSATKGARDGEITEMKDRYAMGDFTGALVVAEGLLELDADDIDAQRYANSCRDVLMQMYAARLGALSQRVRVAVPSDQIRWLSLDHRAGFVLSLIDGSSTVEELLDISGMNRLDALRILYTLFDQRVIALSEA